MAFLRLTIPKPGNNSNALRFYWLVTRKSASWFRDKSLLTSDVGFCSMMLRLTDITFSGCIGRLLYMRNYFVLRRPPGP